MSRMFIASSMRYRPDRSRPSRCDAPLAGGVVRHQLAQQPDDALERRLLFRQVGQVLPVLMLEHGERPGKQSDAGSLDEHPLTPGSPRDADIQPLPGGSPEPADDVTVPPTSPRLRAMLLAVPTGRIASGIFRPARATTTFATVPSPPATTTSSPGSASWDSKSLAFFER